MPTNPDKEYDEVVAFIKEYMTFPQRMIRSAASNPFRYFLTSYKNFGRSLKVIYGMNVTSGKTSSAYPDFVERIATEDSKKEEFYKILISEYPLDAFCTATKKKFKSVNFEKLLRTHERKGAVFTSFGVKELLGFFLAAFTLILRTVPKKIVEGTFQIPFEDFEVALFWVLIFLTGYVILIYLPFWQKVTSARNTYHQVGNILKYIVIKYY